MSDRDIALQLADFLAILRVNRENGQDPISPHHTIAKLTQWEKLVREIAEELE
jgi:hypothetical protein